MTSTNNTEERNEPLLEFLSNPIPPLKDIKVVEFGHYIAGPLLGMLLAEQGADVVHILNPKEKQAYPVVDAILGRGKKHITLNLEDEKEREYFIRLIENADIFIDNYAPDTLEKFHINIKEIQNTSNPALIYCRILPYPSWHKHNTIIKGYEAAVGMEGFLYERPMKPPYYHEFPVGSLLAALYGASAIVATLYARDQSGKGEFIEVNLYESDLFAQILQIFVYNGAPRSFLPFKMVGSPFMGVWKCKDDRYIYLHITVPKHNEDILKLIRENGFKNEIDELYSVMSESTRKDPSLVGSLDEAKEIKRIMRSIYESRTADEWEELLGKDFCCIKIRTLEEWIKESLEAKNGDCIEMEDPLLGTIVAPGPAAIAAGHNPQITPRSFDNQDVEKIIERWKNIKNAPPLQDLSNLSYPLKGIKVVDISRVIAGPFCARILAEFGAEVISIQRPKELGWALSFHVLFNVGKKSVTIDFASPQGKKVLFDFIKDFQPDVFVQNYRSLKFSREIGFSYEVLDELSPNIVYTNINGYGIEGEWQNRPAFEQVVQAVTGIQLAYVGKARPKILPFALLDMGSGLLGAYATLLGLYHKKRTGKGGFCHAHMTSMAMLAQLPQFESIQNLALKSLYTQEAYQRFFQYAPEERIIAKILRTFKGYLMFTGTEMEFKHTLNTFFKLKESQQDLKSLLTKFEKKIRHKSSKSVMKRIKTMSSLAVAPKERLMGFVKRYRKIDKSKSPLFTIKNYPGLTKLPVMRSPIQTEYYMMKDVHATHKIGQDSETYLKPYLPTIDPKKHTIEYPPNEPLLSWIWNFIVWGLYAVRTGNI